MTLLGSSLGLVLGTTGPELLAVPNRVAGKKRTMPCSSQPGREASHSLIALEVPHCISQMLLMPEGENKTELLQTLMQKIETCFA
jgi:hypothetical protein